MMVEITDEIVERLTADLLAGQVEVIARFNLPERNYYMSQLHDHVRGALERAFSAQRPSGEDSRPVDLGLSEGKSIGFAPAGAIGPDAFPIGGSQPMQMTCQEEDDGEAS